MDVDAMSESEFLALVTRQAEEVARNLSQATEQLAAITSGSKGVTADLATVTAELEEALFGRPAPSKPHLKLVTDDHGPRVP